MKKVHLLLALFLYGTVLANLTSPASEVKIGSITGRVMDKTMQQPIDYATIVVKSQDSKETNTGGISQEDGTFEVKGLPEGNLIFEVRFIGHKTHSQQITISREK